MRTHLYIIFLLALLISLFVSPGVGAWEEQRLQDRSATQARQIVGDTTSQSKDPSTATAEGREPEEKRHVTSEALIVAIIAAVPGLLSPVVGWFLNQQGESRKAKKLETLKARIDLIQRLSDSRVHPTQLDTDFEKMKVREIKAVLAEMEALSEFERARIALPGAAMSRWRQATLAYEQISLKGRVYKGLFYAFIFFAASMAVVAPAGLSDRSTPSTPPGWVYALIGGAAYLLIGLAFRHAAVRTYEADKRIAGAIPGTP